MPSQSTEPRQPRVWVPRSLATGCGGQLSKVERLVYLAIADRADNRTYEVWWNGSDIAHRCGLGDIRTARNAMRTLVKVGLLTETFRSERKTLLKVAPVKSTGRLEVPLGAIWDGTDSAPRGATNPAGAFAALLGLLYVTDFRTGRAAVKHETLASKIGCARRQTIRDLDDLRLMLGEGVLIESHTRMSGGRYGATEFTLVWDNLPSYVSRAEAEAKDRELADQDEPDTEETPEGAENFVEVVSGGTESEEVAALCELLATQVLAHGVVLPEKLDRDSESWPGAALALIDDGYTAGQIADVILWSTQDQFWAGRIQRMEHIQRHFTTLAGRPEFQEFAKDSEFWTFPKRQSSTIQTRTTPKYAPAKTPSSEVYQLAATAD